MKKLFLLIITPFLFIPNVTFGASPEPIASITEQIMQFDTQININTDASINVTENIKYYFPSGAIRHGIYRYIPYRYLDDSNNKYFTTPVQVFSIKDNQGNNWNYEESNSGNYKMLKIGDADKTVEGEQNYIINYKVSNVINYFSDHDELYWNVTGDSSKWESKDGEIVPINNIITSVYLPEGVDYNTLQNKCYTGSLGSKEQNCDISQKTGKLEFNAQTGPLTIVVGINKGIIQVVPRDYDITFRHESGWYWLLVPIVFLLLLIRYFRSGRDTPGRGTIAPEFEPPEKLTPAEMGTLIDEKADRQDVSAAIVDLAVRGFIKIKETDKNKYTLIKVKDADNTLLEYEKAILLGIFGAEKEVKLSEVHLTFAQTLEDTQNNLYERLVEKKYFIKNPDKVRANSYAYAILVICFAWIFFWLSWNLVIVIIFCGVLLLIFAKSMPKKTKAGSIAKEKVLGFKEFLYRAERYRVKWQEKENIFERYLPYAMVFGIADKWAKNFEDIYKKPPDWYEGGNWTTFNTVIFVSSLNNFSTTAQTSFSPPSTSASSGGSGFGGGGFSGGGFGGGGGGSW